MGMVAPPPPRLLWRRVWGAPPVPAWTPDAALGYNPATTMPHPPHTVLGRRICVIGPSCAGKSTLAQNLGWKLGFPVLHLDQIAHIPGTNWVERPRHETQREHDAFIGQPCWVVDGSYSYLMPQRLRRADTLILLKAGRFTCLRNFITRCRMRGERAGKLEGAAREFNWDFIGWILFEQPRRWKNVGEIIAGHPHLHTTTFRSFAEIDAFLNTIPHASGQDKLA